eukprot:scaffold28879_cov31-Tisochrysis_lutea.AAC.2
MASEAQDVVKRAHAFESSPRKQCACTHRIQHFLEFGRPNLHERFNIGHWLGIPECVCAKWQALGGK